MTRERATWTAELRAELGDLPTDDRIRKMRGLREAKWEELKSYWTPAFRAGSESEVQRLASEFEALLQTRGCAHLGQAPHPKAP